MAGLAALLLLKGGLGASDAMVPSYNPSLSTPPSISATGPGNLAEDGWSQGGLGGNGESLRSQLDQQKALTAQLRTQLDQQETAASELRSQLEKQRNDSERLAAQLQEQQRSVDRLTLQQGLPVARPGGDLALPQRSTNATAIAIWVVGGLFVVVVAGGGAVLLVVLVLSGQQQSRRQARAQQHYILHNVPGPPSAYSPDYPSPRYPPRSQTGAHPPQTYTLPPRNVRRVEGDYY